MNLALSCKSRIVYLVLCAAAVAIAGMMPFSVIIGERTFFTMSIAIAPLTGIALGCGVLGYSWQTALGAVFISGMIFTILTISSARALMARVVPTSNRNWNEVQSILRFIFERLRSWE